MGILGVDYGRHTGVRTEQGHVITSKPLRDRFCVVGAGWLLRMVGAQTTPVITRLVK